MCSCITIIVLSSICIMFSWLLISDMMSLFQLFKLENVICTKGSSYACEVISDFVNMMSNKAFLGIIPKLKHMIIDVIN